MARWHPWADMHPRFLAAWKLGEAGRTLRPGFWRAWGSPDTLSLDFQPPEPRDKTFCCSKPPVHGVLLQQPWWITRLRTLICGCQTRGQSAPRGPGWGPSFLEFRTIFRTERKGWPRPTPPRPCITALGILTRCTFYSPPWLCFFPAMTGALLGPSVPSRPEPQRLEHAWNLVRSHKRWRMNDNENERGCISSSLKKKKNRIH